MEVVIAVHDKDIVPIGTLKGILRQAGIPEEEVRQ
jgi:predicted RNA binding protein YcfA (HicA-like mRNA interferase family)